MNSCSLYDKALRQVDYHPEVVAYYYKQWEDYEMTFHQHHAIEVMYVITGTCKVEVEQKLFQLKKGDFILLDTQVPHRLIVAKGHPCRMLNIEFILVPKKEYFPSIKELSASNRSLGFLLGLSQPSIILRDRNEVYLALKSLVMELDEREKDNQLMVQLLLSQLLIHIARVVEEGTEEPQQMDIYVKKALHYIQHHYDCDIQIKDMASAVNLHPGYFHRIFKASMNCTAIEYLTSFRMEKAKMLLIQTDIPIIDISGYVGINSRQYFSSMFKKYSSKSPIEFRKSSEIKY